MQTQQLNLGIPANEDPNASYPRLSYGGNDNNQQKSTFWLKKWFIFTFEDFRSRVYIA